MMSATAGGTDALIPTALTLSAAGECRPATAGGATVVTLAVSPLIGNGNG